MIRTLVTPVEHRCVAIRSSVVLLLNCGLLMAGFFAIRNLKSEIRNN